MTSAWGILHKKIKLPKCNTSFISHHRIVGWGSVELLIYLVSFQNPVYNSKSKSIGKGLYWAEIWGGGISQIWIRGLDRHFERDQK